MNFVRTPIKYFDMISGGLRFSTLAEFFGSNSSGKSTTCYQICGYFMQDYPDGRVILLDTESSFDELRCKYVFNWDLTLNPDYNPDKPNTYENHKYKRVINVPTPSLEFGFLQLTQILSECEKTPTIVFWDTLAAAPTDRALSEAMAAKSVGDIKMHGQGMMDRPRIIKYHLRNIMSLIYMKPAIVLIPNQVFSDVGSYTGGDVAGEGSALKHDRHYSFKFKLKSNSSNEVDGEVGLIKTKTTLVSLAKSKFSPQFIDVPALIDIAQGGKIDEDQSLLLLAVQLGFIKQTSGWWYLDEGKPANEVQKCRWTAILEKKDEWVKIVDRKMRRDIIDKFFLVRMLYRELGIEEDIMNEPKVNIEEPEVNPEKLLEGSREG